MGNETVKAPTGQNFLALKHEYKKKYDIRLKAPHEIQGIRKSGVLLLEIMEKVEALIQPGITTDDINTLVHQETIKAGAVPAPLNYRGFPKSVCVSVNEVICHGIPGPRLLKDGDIVNVDITPILNGYYADANKTFFVGNPTPEGEKIVSVARESLKPCHQDCETGGSFGRYWMDHSKVCRETGVFRGQGILWGTAWGSISTNNLKCSTSGSGEEALCWFRVWSLPSNPW